MANPPGLPAELSRPDAQLIVDSLNIRTWKLEKGEGLGKEVITNEKIVKETIIASEKIHAETIEAGQIKAGTITATQIAAGTITAAKLSVTELSAITANAGTITSGTIIGTTIKTASSGARVEITSGGIKGINASAVTKFNFDTTTGILTATAVIEAESGSKIPTEYLTGSITETQISEGAISTPKLAANAVTAAKISVSELSAITGNVGKLTAGTIEGVTIKGSTIEALKAFDVTESALAESSEERAAFKWVKEGATKSEIYATTNAGGTFSSLVLIANPLKTRARGSVTLDAVDGEGKEVFAIVESETAGNHRFRVKAQSATETAERIVISSAGISSFLQLKSAGTYATSSRGINFGSKEVEWAGGTSTSNEPEVEHGLGVEPVSVQLTEKKGTVGGAYAEIVSTSSTKIKLRAIAPLANPSAGQKATIYWQAIG